jgi:hypothetical protein
MSAVQIDEEELQFLHRLGNTCAGQGYEFAYFLASACASFNLMYDSYPTHYRRLKSLCGRLIGVEVSGD